jgi:ribosomal protein S6--L-glutamate ligase
MRLGIVAHRATPTNLSLAEAAPADVEGLVLPPLAALHLLVPGDVALGRLDVRASLDGVEDGFWYLERLAAHGVTVLNPPTALRLAHDKLLCAAALRSAGLPHPRTLSVRNRNAEPPLPFPFVLKPRFGSWGKDVLLCRDDAGWQHALTTLAARPWFTRSGALAQELMPPLGHDLRILIARGSVIGAVKRVAAPGEWRTNIALGATREPTVPPPVACELALSVAATLGGDLVGVDLLPAGPGRYVVLEVNGAVDFTPEYALTGDVYAAATGMLVGRRRLLAIA